MICSDSQLHLFVKRLGRFEITGNFQGKTKRIRPKTFEKIGWNSINRLKKKTLGIDNGVFHVCNVGSHGSGPVDAEAHVQVAPESHKVRHQAPHLPQGRTRLVKNIFNQHLPLRLLIRRGCRFLVLCRAKWKTNR